MGFIASLCLSYFLLLITTIMKGSLGDLRGLLHSVVLPTSNQQYQSDQSTLTNLYKEPGEMFREK